MAKIDDLKKAIDELLDFAGEYKLNKENAEKAYEAYVFGLCIRAVRELGATPTLHGISGPPIPFVFRGSPGQIHSTRSNFGYARFRLNGQEFEIHAGVEFKGTSGMTHELDVCIMEGNEADNCRLHPDDPKCASLVGGWECKCYEGTLGKVHGRAFVGLMDDMGTKVRLSGLCSDSDSEPLRQYYRQKSRPYPHFNLKPSEPESEETFVSGIKNELKKLAKL